MLANRIFVWLNLIYLLQPLYDRASARLSISSTLQNSEFTFSGHTESLIELELFILEGTIQCVQILHGHGASEEEGARLFSLVPSVEAVGKKCNEMQEIPFKH